MPKRKAKFVRKKELNKRIGFVEYVNMVLTVKRR